MPTARLEQLERLTYDGPLSPAAAVGLGVAFVAATAWLLWRERDALGRFVPVAALLRIGAAAGVLWMLTGPMRELVDRMSAPQTVVLAADRSTSMTAIDPPHPSFDMRWAAATDGSAAPMLVAGDRAKVALHAASTWALALRDGVREHQPLSVLADHADHCSVAVERAATHVGRLAAEASRDDHLQQRSLRLSDALSQEAQPALATIADELASGDDADLSALTTAAEMLAAAVDDAARRAASLVRDVEDDQPAGSASESAPREVRVHAALAALEQGAVAEMAQQVAFERLQFDADVMATTAFAERETDLTDNAGPANDSALVEEFDAPPSGSAQTDLSRVLARLAELRSQQPLALSIIYTDGQHTAPEARPPRDVAAEAAAGPVYFVPTGASTPLRDVVIHRVDAPTAAIRGDTVQIEVLATAYDCAGEATRIVLRRAGQVLDEKRVTFATDQIDRRVSFRVPVDELGPQQFELEIVPLDDEASTSNNLAAVSLEVVRDKLTVLLVDGKPRYEFRYLQQLFRRDEQIDCDELLFAPRVRGTGALAANPVIPTDADSLARYDAVILGDVSPREFPPAAQEALVQYVTERAGNLVVIAGSDYMPQAFHGRPYMDLLPVERGPVIRRDVGFGLQLTDEARFHQAVLIADSVEASREAWEALCQRLPIYGLSEYSRPRSTARTVIEAVEAGRVARRGDDPLRRADLAFMAWSQAGAGRVIYLAAPQTYLLRFRIGDRLHYRFWGQLLQWLTTPQLGSGGELVRITTDRARYQLGEPVEVTLWLKDPNGRPAADAEVTLIADSRDGDRQQLPLRPDEGMPGRYLATLNDLQAGAYELTPQGAIIDQLLRASPEGTDDARALVSVHPSADLEMSNTRVNLPLMRQLAEATGGQVIPPTAVEEVLRLATISPVVTESVQRRPLWNRWWLLAVTMACLTGEWTIRKFCGLI